MRPSSNANDFEKILAYERARHYDGFHLFEQSTWDPVERMSFPQSSLIDSMAEPDEKQIL